MKVKEMTTEMLLQIKNEVACELRNRPDALSEIRKKKNAELEMFRTYAKSLIDYIDESLGIKIRSYIKNEEMSNIRFAIALHLRKKGMTLKPIGISMRRTHGSIHRGIENAKSYLENGDLLYGIQHEKINALIERFNTQNS